MEKGEEEKNLSPEQNGINSKIIRKKNKKATVHQTKNWKKKKLYKIVNKCALCIGHVFREEEKTIKPKRIDCKWVAGSNSNGDIYGLRCKSKDEYWNSCTMTNA